MDKYFVVGLFYNDDSRTFTDILLYGQEWSLLILNLLWFLVIDWLSNWNIILAATATYFLDILIVMVRDTLGKKNIARKTMVDEKFLIWSILESSICKVDIRWIIPPNSANLVTRYHRLESKFHQMRVKEPMADIHSA